MCRQNAEGIIADKKREFAMIKKMLSILLVSALATASFAGCGIKTEEAAEKTAVQEETEETEDTEEAEVSVKNEAAEDTAADSEAETISCPDPCIRENQPDEKPTAAEDFYLSVNYDELKSTELPEGTASYGAFDQLSEQAESEMLALLESGEIDPAYHLVADIYNAYVDTDARNQAGWTSVLPYIEEVRSAADVQSLLGLLYSQDSDISMMMTFQQIYVRADAKDSMTNACYIDALSLDLGDSEEYQNLTEYGQQIKDANTAFYQKLLQKAGYDESTADQMIEQRFALETKLADSIYDLETTYREDYTSMTYNAYTLEELIDLAGSYPIESILHALGVPADINYIVTQPDNLKALQTIFTDENLEEMKAYSIIDILTYASMYTDEESYGYYNDWQNAKNGSSGIKSLGKQVYSLLNTWYGELTGQVYADYYFSEEEKEDVTEIVMNLIDVYRKRLEKIDWLSDKTRETAIEKLDAMGVYVGYPDELEFDYSGISFDPEKDFFTNHLAAEAALARQNKEEAGEPVNRSAWGNIMTPNTVNACYELTTNSIYFPAAILQGCFYDKDASLSQNMGAIGLVIGHEITHAFDTTGSQYDKDGNLNNWWTDEDRAAFREKTQAVGARYSSYSTVEGYQVNADLTIGETVADLGGASAALQVLQNAEEEGETVDYREFFEANARIWFRILTKDNAISRLKTDPHAPVYLRVNVSLPQFDEFYEAFDVKEGDPMYTAPEDRLSVW